ncbi:MAG: hypothetical protein ACI9S8_001153 [Chlamydiales bacterium]|jgi:hypothetical protein
MGQEMSLNKERLELNHPSRMVIQMDNFEGKKFPIIVVDNFYKDPDYVRELALSLDYQENRGHAYPGVEATIEFDSRKFWAFIYRYFARQFGFTAKSLKVNTVSELKFSMIGSSGSEGYPIQIPHVDPNLLQGLVFLNPPEQCKGGTSFFTNKEMGFGEVVGDVEVLSYTFGLLGHPDFAGWQSSLDGRVINNLLKMGLHTEFFELSDKDKTIDYNSLRRALSLENSLLTDFWEEKKAIEMKYNRLACFPGFFIHSVFCESGWFGDKKEEMRLTQNFGVPWPYCLEV